MFLPISLNMCFGALIETVLLSTHNIMFWLRNKKKKLKYSYLGVWFSTGQTCAKKVSEYVQEIQQLHTTDQPMAPQGRV